LLPSLSRCGAVQVTISIDIFNDKGELVDHSEPAPGRFAVTVRT